jgi:hypothetical protein
MRHSNIMTEEDEGDGFHLVIIRDHQHGNKMESRKQVVIHIMLTAYQKETSDIRSVHSETLGDANINLAVDFRFSGIIGKWLSLMDRGGKSGL